MQLFRRIQFLLDRSKQRLDLESEMRLHKELRARQLRQQGMPDQEADVEVSRLFGNESLLKERADEMWGWNWLQDLFRDLKQTVRMLAANRGFAAVAITTLALGIGANTAIFSVTDALLLRRLPVADAKQLYRVHTDRMPRNAGNTGNYQTSFSYYVFDHLRAENKILAALVAYVPLGNNKISVRTGNLPEEAAAEMVSGNFFSGLGVQPACGRLLSNEDEKVHAAVAEVGYGYARHRFGDACSAIGQMLYIKGLPFTIVGVASNSFEGVEDHPTDVWIPLQSRTELNAWGSSNKNYLVAPDWWCILMLARLHPGVSRTEAESALMPAYQQAAYDPLGGKPAVGEKPVRISLVQAQGIPGSAEMREPLLIVQVMVGLLLAIACGNVSMLLAVRNASRGREFCVRLALGGSRIRLLRQLLAESLMLVVCGTLLGLVLAAPATRVLSAWAELGVALTPDPNVLAFTLLVSTVAVLIVGVGPALAASRVSISESIMTSAATAFRSRSKAAAGNLMTAIQLAFCLVLLVGMGLLVRTLQNLKDVKTGFPTSGLLVFGISPQANDASRVTIFYRDLVDKLRAVPQVESVTLLGNRIGSFWSNNTDAIVDGTRPQNADDSMLRWNDVGPDFLRTMRIPLLAGRDFNDGDSKDSAPVAIVNRTFVERFLKGQNALGHTASYTNKKNFAIVGVAEDSKYTSLDEDKMAMAWFPYSQAGDFGALHVEVRTAGSASALLPTVRAVVAKFEPNLALLQPRTQEAEFEKSLSTQTLLARMSLAFATLAVALVAIGLYGSISYSVKRRTTEVGIRLALGAEKGKVVWMVLRSGLLLCVMGLAAGLPLVFVSSRFLASMLYGVKPLDPVSILAAVVGILVVGLVATYLPARKAASIDPIKALRYE